MTKTGANHRIIESSNHRMFENHNQPQSKEMVNFLSFRQFWLPNPTLGASVKNQILCFEKAKFLFER